MISSIFYFADTEQEYLDNFNRHQVKPYTIVFCKDTHSVWKNGIRYGGSTSAETQSQISEIIDRDVAPLIAQLEQAVTQANEALSRADDRVDEISAGFEDSIRQISAQIDEEKQRLADKVNELDEQVTQSVGDILDDYQTLVNNLDENISNWFDKVAAGEIVHTDGWNEALKAYLTAVETVEVDPETGETTVKTSNLIQDVNGLKSDVQEITKDGDGKIAVAKSEVIQKASEIVSQVTGVTVANDGTVDTTNTSLQQQITDEGNARAQLATQWANADADTKEVLEWMYSGLTTEAGGDKTFTELVAAAQGGDHSAISNITNLVEKVENEDGTFSYKAKSALTSAVDNALSGFISDTSSDYASAQFFANLNSDIAGLKASTGDASALEGVVTKDSFAAELKAVASKDWAETTMATKLRVPKKDYNGDVVYDEQGNVVYEDVADVLGAMRTTIEVLDGGPQVTNSIDAKVNNAISTFEQQVNDGEACTTLINKVNSDNEVLSGLVSKVTGDTSSNTMLSKVNGMTAGVVTTANLEQAVAGLITRQDAVITLTCTSIGAPPSGALNVGQSVQSLPSSISSEINQQGDKLTLTGSQFNTAFANTNLYSTTIQTQSGPQNTLIPIQYEAGKTGVSGTTFYINDGQYLFKSSGQVIKINIADLSGAVFSKVDNKLNTATAGLAAKNYVDGKEASILASIANGTAEIKLTADKLTIDAGDINAINSKLQINQVVAAAVAAQEVSANKLDVSGTWEDNDENSYTSRTIVDSEGLRIYGGTDGHEYTTQENYYDANVRLGNDGEGWVANGHLIWNGEGDTYIGPGDPENGDDGIYVYDDDGVTKIKLQGEITAKDLSWDNIRGNERLGDGYRVGNKKKYESGERDVVGALYDYGFYVALQTFYHQPANSSGAYGDYIMGHGPSQDETLGAYTTVDWGAIGLGKNNTSVIPNPRNADIQPINYNEYVDGSRNTPPVTLQVKGKDGYVYTGFTGCHNDMYYINGIAIGPASQAGSNSTML